MAIYGECIGAKERASVRVSRLAMHECELEVDSPASLAEGNAALWIGAIGPLAVTTVRQSDRLLRAMFDEPLDSRILKHFNCG